MTADTLSALHGLLRATASEKWDAWEALTRPALADLLGDSGDPREKLVRGTRLVHRGEFYEAHIPDPPGALSSCQVCVCRSRKLARRYCRQHVLQLLAGWEYATLYPVTADAE
jgi:hypothetical protein